MKNTQDSKISRLFNRILKIRLRMDIDRLRLYLHYLQNGFSHFSTPQEKKRKESFEVVRNKLNLSENDLLEKQIGLKRLSILMLLAAGLTFIYSVYQLFFGS